MFDSLKSGRKILLTCALVVFAGHAMAQDARKASAAPQSKITKYGNWTVACPLPGDTTGVKCFASLAVVDAKRKIVLFSWTIGYNVTNKLVIDLVTPTEVFVLPGAQLVFGKGQVLRLPYVSCGIKGCLSRTAVDDKALAMLEGATSATIAVAATNNKPLLIKLSTTGLAEALKAVTGG